MKTVSCEQNINLVDHCTYTEILVYSRNNHFHNQYHAETQEQNVLQEWTQVAFTCSKSTIETLEKSVKYVQS